MEVEMGLIVMSIGGSLVALAVPFSGLMMYIAKRPPSFTLRGAAIAEAEMLIPGF